MSLSINSKKAQTETSQYSDLQLTGQSKTHHRPKSRSIVKMPSINSPSPQFNQAGINKNALLKVSQRRANPQHASAASRKLKPQSFSQQIDDMSITSLKSTGSINMGKLKHGDLTIDTTNTSDHSKHLQDFEDSLDHEELPSPTSPINPIKKTLQVITSNIGKGNSNEPQSSLSPVAGEGDPKAWPSDIFAARKANSYLNPLAKNDSKGRTHRPPVVAKHSLINNAESSRIVKADRMYGSLLDDQEEDEGFVIPNIGSTKHSLKESGCVKAYAANTNQGLVRNYNEDRVSIILNISKPSDSTYQGTWPTCSYFAVYDGHGGDACSDFLRDNLHQMIVRNSSFPLDPINALRKGFAEAEAKFLEQADRSEDRVERSGSCAIVVMIVEDMCYVANVGDSRAVMSCDKGYKVVNLSRDHKPSDQDEQARIVRNGGRVYQSQVTQQVKTGSGPLASSYNAVVLGPHRVYPGRLSVSRTFGDIEAKFPKYDGMPGVIVAEPEIKSFKITDDCDFIVLASDGIYDRLSSEEVSKCVWNSTLINLPNVHQYAAAGVEYIMKQSLLKKTTDNITAVVVGLQGLKVATTSEYPDAAAEDFLSLSPLRPKLKKNNESLEPELGMVRSVRSAKKRFAEGRRADHIVRSKKGQEIIDKTEEMIQNKISMANSGLKSTSNSSKFYSSTNRSPDGNVNLFSSPRMLKLSKVSFAGK